jgi:hypothetical protein
MSRSALARRLFSSGAHHEAALAEIGGGLDVLEAGQHCGLVGAIELARTDLADRHARRFDRCAERLGELLALVVEFALLGDVGEVERVGIGLVAEGRAVPHEYHVSAFPQRLGERLRVISGLRGLRGGGSDAGEKRQSYERCKDCPHGSSPWFVTSN